jgi:hypothetical protein
LCWLGYDSRGCQDLLEITQVCRLNWNVGVVAFLGADVVKLAGLQQACISEVLLIDGITAFCVQVLHDESFWLSCGALVILAVGSPTLGASRICWSCHFQALHAFRKLFWDAMVDRDSSTWCNYSKECL